MKWQNVLKFTIAALFFLYSLNVMVNQLKRRFE